MFCHMFHLQRRSSKTLSTKVTIRSVSSEVYVALLNLLKGHSVPKKERTAPVIAAYPIKLRRIASYTTLMNPLSGLQEERVLIGSYGDSTNKKILLKKEEVTSCIKAYITNTKAWARENCIILYLKFLLELVKEKYKHTLTACK